MATPSPVFPAAVVTDAQLKVANNLIQTAITTAAAATDTTIWVNSIAGFPANCLVSVDKEIIAISSIQTTPSPGLVVATGGRGFDGTAAAAHSAGAKVSLFIDAWHHNALSAEVKAIEGFLGPNGINMGGAWPWLVSTQYNFAAQSPGGSLVVGNNVVTLSPVPAGVNGTDVRHYLYISGGTGTPEPVLITGGTAVAGAASGTVIVNCGYAHTGAWTIRSASSGIAEALIFIATSSAAAGTLVVPAGVWPIYGPVDLPNNCNLIGKGGSHLQMGANCWSYFQNAGMLGCLGNNYHDITLDGLEIDGNIANNAASPPGVYGLVLFMGGGTTTRVIIRNCYIHGYPGNGSSPAGGAMVGWAGAVTDGGGNMFVNNILASNGVAGGFFSTVGMLVQGNILMGTWSDAGITFNSANCTNGIIANNIVQNNDVAIENATKTLVTGNSIIRSIPPAILILSAAGALAEDTMLIGNTCIVTGTTTDPLIDMVGPVSPQNLTITGNILKAPAGVRMLNLPGALPAGWHINNPPYGPVSKHTLTLVNGANENVPFPLALSPGNYGTYLLQISGPTAAYSLGGLVPPVATSAAFYTQFIIHVTATASFALLSQSTGSSVGNQFIVVGGNKTVYFFTAVYDGTNWNVMNYM